VLRQLDVETADTDREIMMKRSGTDETAGFFEKSIFDRFRVYPRRLKKFGRFFPYFRSHLDKIFIVWVIDGASMLLGLAAPLMTKLTIDYAYLRRDMEVFHVIIIVGLLLLIMEMYLGFMRDYLGTRTENLIKLGFSRKLYFHLLRLPYPFFREHTSGELTFRMESDTSGMVSLFLHELPAFLITLLRVVFLLVICFYMNWGATLLIIGIVPVIYYQARFFGEKHRRIRARAIGRAQNTSSDLQEAVTNIALVKTEGMERRELAHYLRNKILHLKTTVREEILAFFQEMTSGALNQAVLLGFTYYTGYMVIKGYMTLGGVIALTMYILQLFGILRSIGGHYQGLLMSLVHIDRLNEILDREVEWGGGNGAGAAAASDLPSAVRPAASFSGPVRGSSSGSLSGSGGSSLSGSSDVAGSGCPDQSTGDGSSLSTGGGSSLSTGGGSSLSTGDGSSLSTDGGSSRHSNDPAGEPGGHLSIRNLAFGYNGDDRVLNDLSMEIPAGTLAGIAGKSGAGKSTLVSLLLRFYEPESGGIFIDGADIRELDTRSHRRRLSISSQEPILWNRSIIDNIRYGTGTKDERSILHCARLADIHPFIESLPGGYGTVVGEGGSRLSRGQKQRIALARCLLGRKSIIILDESTASLDPESERRIIRAIRGLNPKPTVIIVTHNLENLLFCEKVFFLRDGGVAVSGAPVDLVDTDETFRNLFLQHEEAGGIIKHE